MAFLELKNVSIAIKNEPVVQNVSFSVEKGETTAIIGPNGAGKTTLLRAILDFVPYKGTIQWETKPIIGYVPQRIDIERDLPLTVQEFLHLVPVIFQRKRHSPKEVLSFVHLPDDVLQRSISTLSAGEFQRMLIAFALVNHPDILLFDEPTASVDVAGQETIYELLHKLQDVEHFALVVISHDLSLVYRYADNVLCLNKEQICFGKPQGVLSAEGLKNLYGGAIFYHHLHEMEAQK